MAEQVQKGWLKTRDGDKYAPATLIENVYTRSGVAYDTQVRKYLASVQSSSQTSLTDINAKLEEHSGTLTNLQDQITTNNQQILDKLKNINGDDSDILYIIDSDENVIAYVDDAGVHSIDFEMPGLKLSEVKTTLSDIDTSLTTIRADITRIQESLVNIDASDSSALYIIDGASDDADQCNVIAYIDKEGVHSVNFYSDGYPDYNTLAESVAANTKDIADLDTYVKDADSKLQTQITDNATALSTLNDYFRYSEYTDTLYIVDNEDRVVLYVDDTGVHSINMYVPDARDYLSLDQAVTQNQTDIGALQNADAELDSRLDAEETISTTHAAQIAAIEENTKNIQGNTYDNKLYITDSNENVIAYIDSEGIHTINVYSGASGETQYDLNAQLASIHETEETISANLEQEIQNRQEADSKLQTQITDNATALSTLNDYFRYSEYTDVFYFIDKDENVVAYIDAEGMHAVNAFVGSTVGDGATGVVYDLFNTITQLLDADSTMGSQLTNHEERISALETWKPEMVAEVSTLRNQFCKVTNFYTAKPSSPANGDLYIENDTLYIYNSLNQTWENFSGLSHQLKEKTQYFDGSSSDAFYIIDQDEKVVAYFDKEGFHAIDMYVGDPASTSYDVFAEIKGLKTDLAAEINRSKSEDNTHGARLDNIEERLTNVSNVMDFVGVFDTLPEAASYQNGDVCVVGEKEYVLSEDASGNKTWHLMGDVSAEMARLDALEAIVGDPNSTTNATTTHEARLDSLDTALANEAAEREKQDGVLSESIGAVDSTVKEMNENFNWKSPNTHTLYIIDQNENVLAMFNSSGMTITDVTVQEIQNDGTVISKALKNQAGYLLTESSATLAWL